MLPKLWFLKMLEYPYLIAIALIEQEGKRLMPLGGKSLSKHIKNDQDSITIGQTIIQELLLRVFQRSEELPIKRSYGEKSLLLVQVSMDKMQESIPLIKAEWIKSGETENLIYQLNEICDGVWQVLFTRDEGIHCKKI